MPIIGRLDGQVDELIIKPVGRRRAPDEAVAPEAASPPPARQREQAGRPETPGDKRRDDEGLPVWLL